MTTDEIRSRVPSFVDKTEIIDGKVHFLARFTVDEDFEPGDVAGDLSVLIQDLLRPHGLKLEDVESDNDSIWGYIVEVEKRND